MIYSGFALPMPLVHIFGMERTAGTRGSQEVLPNIKSTNSAEESLHQLGCMD